MKREGIPPEIARLAFWDDLTAPEKVDVFLAWEAMQNGDRRGWRAVLARFGHG